MRGLSIRGRLVIGMVLLTCAGLAVANVSGILLLRSYLLDRVDAQVGTIGPGTGQRPPGVTPPDAALPGSQGVRPGLCANPRDPRGLRSDFLLLVLDADGEVACSLGPDLGQSAPAIDQDQLSTSDGLVTIASLDGDTRWRVQANERASGQTVVHAVSLADVDATVTRLTQLSVLVSALVLVLTAAAAWAIARVGLRPLAAIEETAERISGGDLTQRVPSYRRRTEVGRLAHALNGMLGQIERAFNDRAESEERLRRFVSDASHELRTPIASVRGHAEMWRTGVSTDLQTIMSRIESESVRMGALVDDMLLLARMDQHRPLERAPVDVLSLAADAVVDARALQPERTIRLEARPGATPPVVLGDEARLRQILANLLANALAHTPPTSPVRVDVEAGTEHLELSVRDAGPGMTPETVARMFDRFFRADPARTRDRGGTGLGLAIVKSLVEAHGGTVSCTSDTESGTTVTVVLPLAHTP